MSNEFSRPSVYIALPIVALLTILIGGCSGANSDPASNDAPAPAPATGFSVNSTEDLPDSLPGDGKCESPAGTCTLRAAIMEANSSRDLATPPMIDLPAGYYLLAIPPAPLSTGAITSSSGALHPYISMSIQGAGARQTIIDGNQLDSVFLALNPLATVWLSDLTITGGVARELSGLSVTGGGGIFSQGRLVLTRVTLDGNRADYGGGVFSTPSGSVMMDSCTVSNNIANLEGGDIRFDAAALVINSTVDGNRVLPSSNAEQFGFPGSPYGEGGGIDARGAGKVTIINSTISNNHAVTGGGGVNIASSYQGDPANASGSLDQHLGGPMELINTIVAGNDTDQGPRNCKHTIADLISLGGNIADDDSCPLNGMGDLANADPRLTPLANNGGPTDTRALLPGSPAIHAAIASKCPETDQRGVSRGKNGCDIGAFQTAP